MKEFFQDYFRTKFQYSLFQSIFHTAWFTKDWWKYLLEKDDSWTLDGKKYYFCKRFSWRKFYCRMRGHAGVVWYNSYGLEPDMSCKFCDDDLG